MTAIGRVITNHECTDRRERRLRAPMWTVTMSAGGVSLSKKPLAPARDAPKTYSSRWKVVSTITFGASTRRSESRPNPYVYVAVVGMTAATRCSDPWGRPSAR